MFFLFNQSVTEEEAAKAYDVAAIRLKGLRAITNYDINQYDVKSILESAKLPIGKGASKLIKRASVDDVVQTEKRTKKHANLPLDEQISKRPEHRRQLKSSVQAYTITIPVDQNVQSNQEHNNPIILMPTRFNIKSMLF
ncbi:hypothetical protein CFOL_v3_32096 [Cephalotus follicularis]|uniref:AP2 domain-containing protein n=1 Tax=Cephalotus follicularis TaxID=3775 RepID=A0A1Q3D891_CEPFO|nr:hypothetical protein CFOL_v3_32096 [Cephalotus follicularis]